MRFTVVALLSSALVLTSCGTEHLPYASTDEIEQDISADACPTGATEAVCSGSGLLWTALARTGRDATRFEELAQTFTVPREGLPGRVRLRLRIPRPLLPGEQPILRAELREVTGGVVPLSGGFAFATVDASPLSRKLPDLVTLSFEQADWNARVPLRADRTYALVLRIESASAGVQVGVATHQAASYAGGSLLRRAGTTSDVSRAFTEAGTDLAFTLTLDDGTCPAGYGGLGCVDLDECATPGICLGTSTCANSPGSFQCTCPAGQTYDGTTCITPCAAASTCAVTQGCVAGACAACTQNAHCPSGLSCQAGACVATSCLALKQAYVTTASSGTYTLRPSTTNLRAYCDMVNDEGGWTLVANGATPSWTLDAAYGEVGRFVQPPTVGLSFQKMRMQCQASGGTRVNRIRTLSAPSTNLNAVCGAATETYLAGDNVYKPSNTAICSGYSEWHNFTNVTSQRFIVRDTEPHCALSYEAVGIGPQLGQWGQLWVR